MNPIGVVKSCFSEKFGVPRQSMMIQEATGIVKLEPNPDYRTALNHLEGFSHVWIIFLFHQNGDKKWTPTIHPPRVDAPRKVGVFASRSPHRPNPIGMSAVKLEKIDYDAPGGIEIHLSGVDILDGTPVLDIKPYLPFADSIPTASSGWAGGEIPRYPVTFSPECLQSLDEYSKDRHPRLKELITEILEWDPRPTSQRRSMKIESPECEGMRFGFRIFDFDVQWEIRERGVFVRELVLLK
jgi:tRNA-Thr(GGU) m(6)t(6)A37 methyltransferase TsaA